MKKIIEWLKKLLGMSSSDSSSGFTLIELLVVIAILGVLAAVLLVLIDPIQQLARSRDAGRKSSLGQLGRAVQTYYTARASSAVPYPVAATWGTDLTTSGEVKTMPGALTYSAGSGACTTNAVNATWCYTTDQTNASVWVRLESKVESSKCAVGNNPYFISSSSRGSTCLVCLAAETTLATSANACNATQ